jgi:hypothetical protein
MFHALAFNGSLTVSQSYAQVAGVADAAIPRNQANDFLMPFRGKVIAHHVIGVTTSQAQIQAPSLRQIAFPELWPLNITARTAIPDMNRYQTYGDSGPAFLENESLGVYATENGTGTSATSAMLCITDKWEAPPPGMITPLVATATITTVDGQWTLGTLSFSTQLGVGRYAIVGMSVVGLRALYARLVFPGNTGMRPGCTVQDLATDVDWKDQFRLGRMGKFGEFEFNAPPQLEVFGNAAASTPYRVILDVVKVR